MSALSADDLRVRIAQIVDADRARHGASDGVPRVERVSVDPASDVTARLRFEVREKRIALDDLGLEIVGRGACDPLLAAHLGLKGEPPREWRDVLFLDTETTGLSGGTGTYVFLIGLAHFAGDELVLIARTDAIAVEGWSVIVFFTIDEAEATVGVHGTDVTTLKHGDHSGEVALIDDGARTATITAKTPLTQIMHDLGMREGFDVGMEMSGKAAAMREMLASMTHGGKVAMLGLPAAEFAVDWAHIVLNMITIKGIYGREMFETWYWMSVLSQSGVDISPVITHRFDAADYATAFEAVRTGNCGKVVLDWAPAGTTQ